MERSRLLLLLALSDLAAKSALGDPDANDARSADAPTEDEDDVLLVQLLKDCWEHEVQEGDVDQMQRLLAFAGAHNLTSVLPSVTGDSLSAQKAALSPSLIVTKALPIQKAWGLPRGGAIIEGWVSTEDEDQDKDIVPPEAFADALPGYASRRMPLSSEHALKAYPIGHGQRVALVRDGAIFAEAAHPTDPADFEHFPATGSGVYGRFLITEPPAADAVAKGNIGGFSWVGRVSQYQRRPGGRGRVFQRVDPWMESTIAAYPVNSRAILLAANRDTLS